MPVLISLARSDSLAGSALTDAKRLALGIPPVELIYDAMQVCEISLALRTRRQLEAWVRGPLNSLLPVDALMACVSAAGNGGLAIEVVNRHPEALGFGAPDRISPEQLLVQLRRAWLVGGGAPLLIQSQSRSARALGLRNGCGALIHGASRLFGTESVTAIISDRLDGEQAIHGVIELVAPFVQLAIQRIHQSLGEIAQVAPPSKEPRMLSPRELRILEGVRDGLSNREIGVFLNISQHTVKTHLQRIYRKLDVSNRAQALSRALTDRTLNPQ